MIPAAAVALTSATAGVTACGRPRHAKMLFNQRHSSVEQYKSFALTSNLSMSYRNGYCGNVDNPCAG
jgi:hypothetical protein